MTTPFTRPKLKSRPEVHCYTAPTLDGQVSKNEYGAIVDKLKFSSVAPGGFGQASFLVYLPDPLVPYPELQIFSRVVIARGADVRWIGEISDSRPLLQNNQYALSIQALGLGSAIRDDNFAWTYTNQTLQQIAQAQLAAHTTGTFKMFKGIIDADQTQLFPDNPSGTFSPQYDNQTVEEIYQDLATLGSTNNVTYMWGTEAHPDNVDAFGFPTCRLWIRQRDVTTTHYLASIAAGDVWQHNVGQATQYCYNVIEIDYSNGSSGVVRHTASDPRLNADGTQGTAPFRWRKLTRDYSGVPTIGGSQATAIASTYLNQYQNPSNKGSVTLRSVRDANGNPLPLDVVVAGKNIFIPDIAPRGASVPFAPTPGINQFYIVNAEWSEDNEGPMVVLQLDNFVDKASYLVAKLMLAADVRARSSKLANQVFGPGIPDTINGGGTSVASGAGQQFSWGFSWHAQMAQAPTSTTTSTLSLVNGTSTFVNNLTVYGGNAGCSSVAAGATTYLASITSHGNTLLAVDDEAATLDWHCGGCDTAHGQLAISEHIRVWHGHGERMSKPGESALKITCPGCGFEEHFNTALGSGDEDERAHDQRHVTQARLIRQLMRHPHVGLEVRE